MDMNVETNFKNTSVADALTKWQATVATAPIDPDHVAFWEGISYVDFDLGGVSVTEGMEASLTFSYEYGPLTREQALEKITASLKEVGGIAAGRSVTEDDNIEAIIMDKVGKDAMSLITKFWGFNDALARAICVKEMFPHIVGDEMLPTDVKLWVDEVIRLRAE